MEASHDHWSPAHSEGRSREINQRSVSRTPTETAVSHSYGSQYQKLERPQKLEQQYKPTVTNNPESCYMGSKHAQQTQHHLSLGSLSEQDQQYTQTSYKQETKNDAVWSGYKPAGPLSCHTPQHQQLLGYNNDSESPSFKTILRATAMQTKWETSPNIVVSRPASPQGSSRRNSHSLHLLPEARSQNVREAKYFPPDSERKVYTPPEPIKREFQRLQTPPSNTILGSTKGPHTPSPGTTHCDLQELHISNIPEIICKGFLDQCFKISPKTESVGSEGQPPQHPKNENSQTKGIKAFHHSECPSDERNSQHTQHHPDSGFLSDQDLLCTETDCSQEITNHAGRSRYKPAGPLSCYRPEPQPQKLVDWYSGTESPLSKVVLRTTRTHTMEETSQNVALSRPTSPQETGYRKSQSLETMTESRSQNVCDLNFFPPEPTKSEYQKIQSRPINTIISGSQRLDTPSPEPISLKSLQRSNTPETIHEDFLCPYSKTSLWTETSGFEGPSSSHVKNENSQTKGNTGFHHSEHSTAERNTADYVETCDMYLNTTAKQIKLLQTNIYIWLWRAMSGVLMSC
ncbi:uncharacterized protein LOC142100255 [Mixophyes fleayi]|uniref:uncharacterized protein LOC142100255 n=1 Tax=Mixophyes fleayi TaxID=3061075 RepID=UPI003F4D7CE5